jgi:hypothetical protein
MKPSNGNGCLLGYLILVFVGILVVIAVAIWAFKPALTAAGF